ncbi:hypothetical protein [Microbulbifer halophilus]|uniref:hypothetical protein n=1 Tax=Microbulbifer halophilus TaxID=453963 RepID=UPI0036071683
MIKKLKLSLIVIFANCLLVVAAQAQLVVEISGDVQDPTPIAISPFGWSGSGVLSEDVSEIVSADLRRSGLFDPVRARTCCPFPRRRKMWRIAIGESWEPNTCVTGRIEPQAGGYLLTFDLVNIFGQSKMFTKQVRGSGQQLRDMAHRAADEIFEAITGIRGAFSTEMLYVQETTRGGRPSYALMRADIDGARGAGSAPFRSAGDVADVVAGRPGSAYVSFETGRRRSSVKSCRPGAPAVDRLRGDQQLADLVAGWNQTGDGAIERRQSGDLCSGPEYRSV